MPNVPEMVFKTMALLLLLNHASSLPQDIEETMLLDGYKNLTPIASSIYFTASQSYSSEAEEVMKSNPYLKAECSLEKTMTVMNMKLCIMKNDWINMSMRADSRRTDVLTKKNYLQKLLDRPLGTMTNYDCLFNNRTLRPVPTSCYLGWNQWDWTNTLVQFFNEVINDLRFTYDFVLYNKEAEFKLENMLWYNVAYLKQLVITVPNPADLIAPALKPQHDYTEVLNNLSARLLSLSGKVSTLERKLDYMYSKSSPATDTEFPGMEIDIGKFYVDSVTNKTTDKY